MEHEALIQKYIQDSLNEAEKAQFEALVESDADFALKVAEFENVHAAIKANEKAQLKSHLQQLEATQNDEVPAKKTVKKTIRLAIAVAILLVLGLIGNYFMQQATLNETLYATYFEPYPNALAPVTRTQETPTEALPKAMRLYEDGKHQEAFDLISDITKGQENPETDVLFYQAMCLLNLQQETEALNILREIKHSKTRFTPQIYWYGALIHIKFKENEKALKALEYMDEIQTTFKSKEREILKQKL
ncbi:hypothetical protein EZY14_003890 [Kordia sp. TARA_039_SRF]|nr:hypothetical protein EZY14_003890 [Kordia sp. TARA_039_SRF]